MRAERLFRVLGLVDPALVEEAMEARRRPRRRWLALAACLTLAVGVSWLAAGGFRGFGAMGGGASGGADSGGSAGDGGSGIEDGTVFMYYAGPVFPLTTVEDPAGLTAEREVTWDFAPGAYPDGEPYQWGAGVTDAYVLSNPTDRDITLTALYPFASSFDHLETVRPAVTVDGGETEAVLYAGPYSGGFQSTFGAEIPDTMNLDTLNSWEEYKALLEGGEYLAQALEEYPALDIPVTVYEFSDFEAPQEYPAATQAISFDVDREATRIFTSGFNGLDWDGGTSRRYSFFVPNGMRNEPYLKLLIVLGEDIGDYTLQGYQNGGCNPREEIDGVSCAVTRTETTLDAALERVCRDAYDQYQRERDESVVPFELYRGAVSELLTRYSLLSNAPVDRYIDGRLDDAVQEAWTFDRVLYLAFPVTVPAGGSVSVECGLWKFPSFDYACSGSENVGLQGYDLVTRLGSGLAFTAQRASLVNTEGVELAGQSFGFDLESGVTSVELDLEQEHYYMEFRVRED